MWLMLLCTVGHAIICLVFAYFVLNWSSFLMTDWHGFSLRVLILSVKILELVLDETGKSPGGNDGKCWSLRQCLRNCPGLQKGRGQVRWASDQRARETWGPGRAGAQGAAWEGKCQETLGTCWPWACSCPWLVPEGCSSFHQSLFFFFF